MSKQPEDALARLIEPDVRRLANMGVKKELQQQLADAILRDPEAWLDLKERVIQAWPYGRGPIKVVENQATIAGPPKTAEFLLALLLSKKTGEGGGHGQPRIGGATFGLSPRARRAIDRTSMPERHFPPHLTAKPRRQLRGLIKINAKVRRAIMVQYAPGRASGRAVVAEPYDRVKVSTACPSFSLFPHAAVHVPLPQDRIPRSGLCCRRYLGRRPRL